MVCLSFRDLSIDLSNLRSRFIGRDQVTSWRSPAGAAVLLPKRDAIRQLLEEAFDFTQTDPAQEPGIPVEILNASAHPDWDTLAAERLTYAGYETETLPDAPEPGTPTHVIDYGLVADAWPRLRRALGLKSDALAEIPDPDSEFAFRLIVGDDFNPCFNPTRDQGW